MWGYRPPPGPALLLALLSALTSIAFVLEKRSGEEAEREGTRELFERVERYVDARTPPGLALAECLNRHRSNRARSVECARAYHRRVCNEPVARQPGSGQSPIFGTPPASTSPPELAPGASIEVAQELERRERLCPPTAEERRAARTRRGAARKAGTRPSFALVRRVTRPVLLRAGCKRPQTVVLDSSNLDPGRDALDTRSLECDGEVVVWERYATERARRADDPIVPPGPFFANGNIRVTFDDAWLPRGGAGGLERLPGALRRACGCGRVETEGR